MELQEIIPICEETIKSLILLTEIIPAKFFSKYI